MSDLKGWPNGNSIDSTVKTTYINPNLSDSTPFKESRHASKPFRKRLILSEVNSLWFHQTGEWSNRYEYISDIKRMIALKDFSASLLSI
jgi:hypothetical protein